MTTRSTSPADTAAALDAAEPTATALLTIDLDALRANYRILRDMAPQASCAAVIKANAYGTGAEKAATALTDEGCDTFFVATFNEGLEVREAVREAVVYILDGLCPGSCGAFVSAGLRPVLSSLEEAREWSAFCMQENENHPAALHVDTGMNRLGLRPQQIMTLFEDTQATQPFTPALLMSHLACADEPDHPKNRKQLQAFRPVRESLPECPASLANSGGIQLGQDYHFDMVRAGVALYGAKAVNGLPPLAPVVQLHARIAQVHEAAAGETVGYGAVQTLQRDTRIATISLGYADGIPRCAGAQDGRPGMTGYIEEYAAPVLGRVSMDLITLDVTDVPQELARRGAWVEILGSHVSIDDLAKQAGTIGYEILTSLSRRAQRVYTGNAGDSP